MMIIIPSDETSVMNYIDTSIEFWRHEKEAKDLDSKALSARDCDCYIDAYQAMRVAFFGQPKPTQTDLSV